MDSREGAPAQVYEDFVPTSELVQEQDSDTLLLDLTGFKKEQLRIQLTRTGILKISGKRPVAGENKWLRFEKDFPVSENCDKRKISAKFENGILYVKQPKLITSTEKKDQELPASDAQQTKKPADEPQPTPQKKDAQQTKEPADEPQPTPQKKDEEQTKGEPTPTEELPKHQATNADQPGKEEPNTKETKDLAENTPAVKTGASSTVKDGNKPENNANIVTSAVLAEKLKMPRELMNLILIALLGLVIGLYISNMMKSNN